MKFLFKLVHLSLIAKLRFTAWLCKHEMLLNRNLVPGTAPIRWHGQWVQCRAACLSQSTGLLKGRLLCRPPRNEQSVLSSDRLITERTFPSSATQRRVDKTVEDSFVYTVKVRRKPVTGSMSVWIPNHTDNFNATVVVFRLNLCKLGW